MSIESHALGANVTQELVPVEPDVVLYYEGANQFWPSPRPVRFDSLQARCH
jgi:hypothetical protein